MSKNREGDLKEDFALKRPSFAQRNPVHPPSRALNVSSAESKRFAGEVHALKLFLESVKWSQFQISAEKTRNVRKRIVR